MVLQVAACPRCRAALVFGERACRACGQTFDYGVPPPEPTYAQIVEALAAVGLSPPLTLTSTSVTAMDGLDTGRHADVGDVEWQEVSGLMETAMFAAFTPKHVEALPLDGFDDGRFAETMASAMAAPVGLERTEQAVDAPPIGPNGAAPVEGLEASPSTSRAPQPRAGVKDSELQKVLCRCSEVHRLPRCPACGTSHPERR